MSDTTRFQPRRELGRTGFTATVLGSGDLADRSVPFATCVATLRRAIDAGLNVIDTAPGYEDGYSEQIVGAAVQGRARPPLHHLQDRRTGGAGRAADRGVAARLGLDYTDAFVFHGLSSRWRSWSG
jgi:aryl-alcohol dehydrogenase-like predicted oxidoreductase